MNRGLLLSLLALGLLFVLPACDVGDDDDTADDDDTTDDDDDDSAADKGWFQCTLPEDGWPQPRGSGAGTGRSGAEADGLSGTLAWSFGAAEDLTITMGTPTVTPDGIVLATGHSGGVGNPGTFHLNAISPEGALLWSTPLDISTDREGPAICAEGTAILTLGNSLLVFSLEDGELLASAEVGEFGWRLETSAVPGGGLLYVAGSGFGEAGLVAVRSNGSVAWVHLGSGTQISTDPAVRSDGSVVFAEDIGGNISVLAPDGSVLWAVPSEGVDGLLVTPDDGVIASEGNQLRSLDSSGTLRWTWTHPGGALLGAPQLAMDGSLRITTNPSHPEPATLTALDENGTVLWSTTIDDFSQRATLGAEGTSLVAPRGVSEHLTAIGSDGTPLWSIETGAHSYAAPALVPGAAYLVINTRRLIAVH